MPKSCRDSRAALPADGKSEWTECDEVDTGAIGPTPAGSLPREHASCCWSVQSALRQQTDVWGSVVRADMEFRDMNEALGHGSDKGSTEACTDESKHAVSLQVRK